MTAFHRGLAAHMLNAAPAPYGCRRYVPHDGRFERTWLALTIAATLGMLCGYWLAQL